MNAHVLTAPWPWPSPVSRLITLKPSMRRGSGATSSDQLATPAFRQHLSFRGQPYRLLSHQHGVGGFLQVRVLAAASDLPHQAIGRSSPTKDRDPMLPTMTLGVGREWGRTTAMPGPRGAISWPREVVVLEVLKNSVDCAGGADGGGKAGVLEVQAMNNRRDIVAMGNVDIEPLLLGDAQALDVWCELQPRGRVHLLVDYTPRGMAPQRGDVVYCESWARWPRSVVLPPGEPLVVADTNGAYVLAQFTSASGLPARACVHRNCVFVVERLSWWDQTLQLTAQPVDALLQTDAGQWAARKARPALASLGVLVGPLAASAQVAWTSAQFAGGALVHGTMAVARQQFS